jgi:hypothetical protein
MCDDTPEKSSSEGSSVSSGSGNRDDNDNACSPGGGTVRVKEIGGRDGPDPTRYGDWEKNGRCIDF